MTDITWGTHAGVADWVSGLTASWSHPTPTLRRLLLDQSDVAAFKTAYEYPIKFKGRTVYENRITRLRLGERLFRGECVLLQPGHKAARPLKGFTPEVAIGLVTQNEGAQIRLQPRVGFGGSSRVI